MLILEFKVKGKAQQYSAIEEAIRTFQFVRNKALRFWMDNDKVDGFDLNKYCAVLAKEFAFAKELNSQSRQAAAERAWAAISRFFDNCKSGLPGKKGYPQFQKDNRSVEYKTTGWNLSEDFRHITFTDKKMIGRLKMLGTRDLNFYAPNQIKRVRLVKRATGYFVQFVIKVDRQEPLESTGSVVGLDVGLESFYTDSNGAKVENPRFYRQGQKALRFRQRRVSRKVKGSKNRAKARTRLARKHLKISNQRKDHAIKLARYVCSSNDVVVYEDLKVRNMVKNHCLAKSINDAGWYLFRVWLEYFGNVFGRLTIAVNPAYTSQECSSCGAIVKKSLSTRTHVCQCGCELDRDENAAINILVKGLGMRGHRKTAALEAENAWGELTSTLAGAILSAAS
jgi:putative transposase